MQPMSPQERKRIRDRNPAVTEADLDEYEKLLAQRFASDSQHATDASKAREARIQELYNKLFAA